MATIRTQNREIIMSVVLASPATEDQVGYEALTYLPFDNCDITKMPNLGGYEWSTLSAGASWCNNGSLNFDNKDARKAVPTEAEVYMTEITAATVLALADVEAAEPSAAAILTVKLELFDSGASIGDIYQQFKVTSYIPDNSEATGNRLVSFALLPASVHQFY